MGYMKKGDFRFTESNIQKRLAVQYMTNPQYTLAGLYVFGWESDFLCKTKSGYWYEVEIKLTRADFLNDFKHKKDKFDVLTRRPQGVLMPNYFSYCVPEALEPSVRDLVPEWAGLSKVTSHGQVWPVKSPTRLYMKKISDDELRLCEKFYYNYSNLRWKEDHKDDLIAELRRQVSFLKAEFKATTGFPIEEVF